MEQHGMSVTMETAEMQGSSAERWPGPAAAGAAIGVCLVTRG